MFDFKSFFGQKEEGGKEKNLPKKKGDADRRIEGQVEGKRGKNLILVVHVHGWSGTEHNM